ncbi:MAG: hypothetical protein AABX53_00880 [Nanoarchaeota archaeon]
MVNRSKLTIGTIFGIASALQFTAYFSKPNIPEMGLLRSASTYIRQYDGQNPREALDYIQRTLQVIAKKNPEIQEISELEKGLSQVNEEIGTSQNRMVYQPVLKSIGDKMRDASEKNSRNSWTLWAGILNGAASLTYLTNPYNWRRKKD